jgi:hypothetical protein
MLTRASKAAEPTFPEIQPVFNVPTLSFQGPRDWCVAKAPDQTNHVCKGSCGSKSPVSQRRLQTSAALRCVARIEAHFALPRAPYGSPTRAKRMTPSFLWPVKLARPICISADVLARPQSRSSFCCSPKGSPPTVMPNDLPDADTSKVRSLTPASVFPSFYPYFLDVYTFLPRSLPIDTNTRPMRPPCFARRVTLQIPRMRRRSFGPRHPSA